MSLNLGGNYPTLGDGRRSPHVMIQSGPIFRGHNVPYRRSSYDIYTPEPRKSPKKRLQEKPPSPPSSPQPNPSGSPKKRLQVKVHSPQSSPYQEYGQVSPEKESDITPKTLATPDIISNSAPLPITRMELPSRLTDIGPDELLRIQSNNEGRLKIGNISATELDNWKTRYPKFFESEELRFEYNFLSGGFLIKCMPLPTHDSLQTFFSHTVSFSLAQRFGFFQSANLVTVSSGTTFSGFVGDPTGESKKLPDAYVQSRSGDFPTVVCEAGWAEGHAQLMQDARLWLLYTGGQTRVVIVISFTENTVKVPTASDNSDSKDTTTSTFNEEKILLESISEETNTSDLAESLLLLDRKGKLQCPLVGNLEAVLHVYKASAAGDDIFEFFSTKFLSTPTLEDSGPKEFGITLGELLGDCIPEGENPDEEVKFSLEHLKTCVEMSLPRTEKLRATDRALSLLRSTVGLPDIETFAQSKRRGVDPFTFWKRA